MADNEVVTVKTSLGISPTSTGQQWPSNPSVGQTYTYVSPKSVSPYQLMDDCYDGSGYVRTGEYLIPFNREYHYLERRETAAYKNFVKPMIRALTEPVFTEEAPRIIADDNGNELNGLMANTFIKDVDNDGTAMQEFTEDIITTARLHGVCFCLVDNFGEDEQPLTASQAIEGRIMPYALKKTALEVEGWHTDEFGRLQDIMFAEDSVSRDGKLIKRARKWTAEYSVLMELITKTEAGRAVQIWTEVGAYVYHGLGRIPVVSIYFNKRKSKKNILVDPPMYDLALLNLVIWNKDSEIRDLERSSGFSVLTIQTDNVQSVTVGPKNALVIPMEATIAPNYISPNPSIMTALADANVVNREDLFRMAEQAGISGVKQESSGVSLAWKFYGQESQLKKTSKAATVFEEAIMDLFRAWTKEEFVYVVQYPTEFQPGDVTAELTMYDKALKLPGVTKKMGQKILEKVSRMLFADEDDKEIAVIIDDIYTKLEEVEDKPMPAIADTSKDTEEVEETEVIPASSDVATGEGLKPDTVLNGAQVTSLVDICVKVTEGFPRENAVAIAMAAFGLTQEAAEAMIPKQGTKPEVPEEIA